MSTFEKTRNLVYTALCVAMGVALPVAFHAIPNAGSIFLPMHIPVLLCGMLCGWPNGLICGAVTPLISSLFTGMPPTAILPSMMCELAVYGLVAGLLVKLVRSRSDLFNTYVALVGAMLAGRLVAGATKALIFHFGEYSLRAWVTASFVTALPGIVIQLIAIPTVLLVLRKARMVAVA